MELPLTTTERLFQESGALKSDLSIYWRRIVSAMDTPNPVPIVRKIFQQLRSEDLPSLIDMRSRTYKCRFLIHAAVAKRQLEILRMLVEYGCQTINAISSEIRDDRPLNIATRNGHMECVEFLLAAGADPILANGTGRQLAEDAIASGNVDMVRFWVNRFPAMIHGPDAFGETLLHSAADPRSLEILRYLVPLMREWISYPNENGMTPIVLVAARGQNEFDSDAIRLLFRNGAHISESELNSILSTYKRGRAIKTTCILAACSSEPIRHIPDDTRLKYRYRVYFKVSLLTRLLEEF